VNSDSAPLGDSANDTHLKIFLARKNCATPKPRTTRNGCIAFRRRLKLRVDAIPIAIDRSQLPWLRPRRARRFDFSNGRGCAANLLLLESGNSFRRDSRTDARVTRRIGSRQERESAMQSPINAMVNERFRTGSSGLPRNWALRPAGRAEIGLNSSDFGGRPCSEIAAGRFFGFLAIRTAFHNDLKLQDKI